MTAARPNCIEIAVYGDTSKEVLIELSRCARTCRAEFVEHTTTESDIIPAYLGQFYLPQDRTKTFIRVIRLLLRRLVNKPFSFQVEERDIDFLAPLLDVEAELLREQVHMSEAINVLQGVQRILALCDNGHDSVQGDVLDGGKYRRNSGVESIVVRT